MSDPSNVLIRFLNVDNEFAERLLAVARRKIEERCSAEVVTTGGARNVLDFEIRPGIGAEGFMIQDSPSGAIRITGNDERGLLYGLGRFLRCSHYDRDTFTPGTRQATSVPEKPVRGIYFATHFHNFYHEAPVKEVQDYIEDIALWGINTLCVWFDMHHYKGIGDPDARLMISRLKCLLNSAKNLKLSTSLVFIANEGYADSPHQLRAEWSAGKNGYHHQPQGFFQVELCPNKPGARELLLRWAEEKLMAFADVMPDYLWIWPYDTGGCTCDRCAPWGANGFLSIAEPIARLYRSHVPCGRVILSTWYFDHFIDGEWEGLAKAFRNRPDWVDYIMVDDSGDTFPDYPLRHGVPGGLPMLNFPEISMYKSWWGGVGANPLLRHLQALWDVAGKHVAGGFPYSEGIYEDINKAIIAQFQWKGMRSAVDIVREYVASEYSVDVVDDVVTALDILEKNNQHSHREQDGIHCIPMERTIDADRAWQLLQRADALLSPQVRKSWHWRILYLRGLIDAELAANDCRITDKCEEAFKELVSIYHAENAALVVSPPTREALKLKRSWL